MLPVPVICTGVVPARKSFLRLHFLDFQIFRFSICEACAKKSLEKAQKEESWKATKEYLNQRGTKIRVFRVFFRPPFLPPFLPYLSPLFPLQALFTLPPRLPSSPPPFSKFFLTPGKLRFRYPSDLGTL